MLTQIEMIADLLEADLLEVAVPDTELEAQAGLWERLRALVSDEAWSLILDLDSDFGAKLCDQTEAAYRLGLEHGRLTWPEMLERFPKLA